MRSRQMWKRREVGDNIFNYYLLSHKPRWEIHRGAKLKHSLCKQYG